jgi:formylglycine-generating enzyme required for sulfatase activity
MSKYLITQDQYYAVMGTNPSHFHGGDGREPAEGEIQGKRPVENVTWYHAIVFCNKLSIMEGLTPAYEIQTEADTNVWSTNPDTWGAVPYYDWDNHIVVGDATRWNTVRIVTGSTGYRLPTEAQWEYACRAGTTTAYNTGDTITDDTGWYTANSSTTGERADRRTRQVGLKPANAWGLYDMHGNVWEWVWDWLGEYTDEAKTDPVGASVGSDRVLRGGSWFFTAVDLRSAPRYGGVPSFWNGNLGFRVLCP